ncbi:MULTISPECIES: L-rhamnose mutarotase [unclassified Embleya]|uniref:L-rhamnose mutarotase n=1 Tax=unclassified Embleya TaxID=2699296 RepID=UPI0033F157BD
MRVALHTRLAPGREEEYEQAHREVPAELTAAIRAAGVHEWNIWRSGLDLFHVLDCDDYGALLDSLADLPVNIRWQARMGELTQVSHDYSADGKEATLPLIWSL